MKKYLLQITKSSGLIVLLLTGATTGCARQISSNVYSAASIGEASTTYAGVIVSARPVIVQDKEYLEENGLGVVGGGLAGGVIGSQFGKGGGNTLATVAGAVVGATTGAFAEKALKEQNAIEYIVQLDNGSAMTIVQGVEPSFTAGQAVWIIIGSHHGQNRSRITSR